MPKISVPGWNEESVHCPQGTGAMNTVVISATHLSSG
jgi:hypothetical protein